MGRLAITEGGLTLGRAPGSSDMDGPAAGTKPPQAMRLDLEDGVLEEILQASRSGRKGVHISFGKTVVSQECSTAHQYSS